MLKSITLLVLTVCIAATVGDVPINYLRPAYNSGPMSSTAQNFDENLP